MTSFCVRFLLCNLVIALPLGIILAARRLLGKHLSCRMQYNLWYLLLALLTLPFLPIRPVNLLQMLLGFRGGSVSSFQRGTLLPGSSLPVQAASTDWMNDFSISVSRGASAALEFLLLSIWLAGIFVMLVRSGNSLLRLHRLMQSALPLQNQDVWKLYRACLEEMQIKRNIPIYSTAFLKSPVIVGLFRPRIYLPIHLISDYNAADMRYMLLHELQHYKHKDALANHWMNLTAIVYWFNPMVRYAFGEMRLDREIACDASVLRMLDETEYEAYGNTLLCFAEKISHASSPFAAGIGGNMAQMKRRILNIVSYEPPSFPKKLKSLTVFTLTALLLFGFAPAFSIYAAPEDRYEWQPENETVSYADLSSYFGAYNGSFVLYDAKNDTWTIYNEEYATLRTSPDSTYKIYDALFALENGIITPESSKVSWNQELYPFDTWNKDQDLSSAMANSVNWYFQTLDAQMSPGTVSDYIERIGYGNQNMTGDFSSYWLESSLKISPIEQTALFAKLYDNDFGFSPDNVQAVKDSILLTSSPKGALYGKTGTGRIDGQDVNGWFIGYVERSGQTRFFAVNIQGESAATGSKAAEIAREILSDLSILP